MRGYEFGDQRMDMSLGYEVRGWVMRGVDVSLVMR
jgi:hypothetical protein